MNEAFVSYLRDIEMSSTLMRRVRKMIDDYSNVFPENALDVFVEDYVDESGRRNFEHVNMFSENYWFSINNFSTRDGLSVTSIRNQLQAVVMDVKDYDFQRATYTSRLSLDVQFVNRVHGSLSNYLT